MRTERGGRTRRDIIVVLAARNQASHAAALARQLEEDGNRLAAAQVDGGALDRASADCSLIAALAHDIRNVIAIDCSCGDTATTATTSPPRAPPPAAPR